VCIYRLPVYFCVCLYGYGFLHPSVEKSVTVQTHTGNRYIHTYLAHKASGVIFCTASKAGNLSFWGTLLPQKSKIGRIGQRATTSTTFTTITLWLPNTMIARRVDVGSACADIRSSPKTGVLVLLSLLFQHKRTRSEHGLSTKWGCQSVTRLTQRDISSLASLPLLLLLLYLISCNSAIIVSSCHYRIGPLRLNAAVIVVG